MTNFTHYTLDLPNIHRHSVGFDRVFDDLNRAFAAGRSNDNYPPYNIVKIDDAHYQIEIAIAGFNENEVEVELIDSKLLVTGNQSPEISGAVEYVHKGISNRNFERVFNIADYVEVRSASVKNGILTIDLEQVLPEHKLPKKIPLSFAK